MNKQESTDIIRRIAAAYPKFDLTGKVGQARIELWMEHLEKLDYSTTLQKLNKHISESKYPPTIAEINVEPKPKNEYLERIKQMKKEVRNARLHQKH